MACATSSETNLCYNCIVCGSIDNLKRCARCKKVVYCCREHQISDWASHKLTCKNKISEVPEQILNLNNCNGNDSNSGNTTLDGKIEDFIEFDKRSYIESKFCKPRSKNPQDIAKFIFSNLEKNGYCIVDGMFEEAHLDSVLDEVKGLELNNVMQPGKLAGGLTGGEEKEKVVNSNIRSDKLKWFEGNEKEYTHICKVVQTMDTIVPSLNQFFKGRHNVNRRTKAMVASYPGNGTYYRQHVDNPKQDGRLITCILYLNKNWDVQQHGGLLRIFPEGTENYIDIPPVYNRLLLFWSDRRNPHEVQPAFKHRYAITVWYFDEKERESADQGQLQKNIKETYGDLALLEIKTKMEEKTEIESRIENETEKVLGSLSEDELEAISALLQGQPDPKAVLESLGISSIIQDKLLDLLTARTS